MASGVSLKSLATGVEFVQLAGGGVALASSRQVYVYTRGTSTQVGVFSDAGLTTPVAQPLVTGSDGTPGAVPGYVAANQSIDFYDVLSGARMQAEAVQLGSVSVFLDARQWGVIANDSTDCATPFVNFNTALNSAGPGACGVLPHGTMRTSGPFAVGTGAASSYVQGHGMGGPANVGGSVIKKEFDGDLVTFHGPGGSIGSQANQMWYGGLSGVTLDGNGHTGRLLDAVYCVEHFFEHIHFLGGATPDQGCEFTQVWDSQIDKCVFDGCAGTTTAKPALYINSSRAASGLGASVDSSNQIHVNDCNFVSNQGPDIRVDKGTLGTPTDPNQIYFRDNKCESTQVATDRVIIAPATHDVHIEGMFLNTQGFAGGFSTPVSGINWQPSEFCTLQRVWILGKSPTQYAQGVYCWAGQDAMHVIDKVYGYYAATPTSGFHINLAGGSGIHLGRVDAQGATSVVGGLGTTIQTWGPGPVRCVAGAVSDASFARVPPIGTMAMDTTNSNFYVKTSTSAGWKKVAIA